MSLEKAHHVFYDEDRAEDYKGLDPDKPKDENCYEPFLSPTFLTEILTKMGIVKGPGDDDDDIEVIDLCSSEDESSKVDEAVPNTTTASDSKKRRKKKKHKKVKRVKSKDKRPHKWQIHLGGNWKDFDNYTSTVLESAFASGSTSCPYTLGRWGYILDFPRMLQVNTSTNKSRSVRRVPR